MSFIQDTIITIAGKRILRNECDHTPFSQARMLTIVNAKSHACLIHLHACICTYTELKIKSYKCTDTQSVLHGHFVQTFSDSVATCILPWHV